MPAGLCKTAWMGGCQSWYLDGDGEPILWPYTFGRWVGEVEFVCPQVSNRGAEIFNLIGSEGIRAQPVQALERSGFYPHL